jgi:hypothetical protein
MKGMRNAYKMLVRNPQGKRLKCRQEDNILMDSDKLCVKGEMDSYCSGQGLEVDCYELSGSVKSWNFHTILLFVNFARKTLYHGVSYR